MNYTEAVKLVKQGDENGFNFLYEETYKSKYYLALKYMQNEEAAKDVLQDAYIQAFRKLDTLENPEKFASWLGIIVANTAKNALQKKNPMLFSEIVGDQEEEEFEYQIEDESIENQPEIAYSQRETQELVHELIDSLSEEQRMCILMFHIEGQSISEIAESLGCSENTVKSRLNYGRKNIKGKAEELQKKGYKLYGMAPVPFLLCLLKSEEHALAAQGMLETAGKAMASNIADKVAASGAQSTGANAGTASAETAGAGTANAGTANAGTASAGTAGAETNVGANVGTKMAAEAVKKGFIHTLAGKLTVAGVVCLVAAGTTAVVMNNQKSDKGAEQNAVVEEKSHTKEKDNKEVSPEETKTEEIETEKAVTDDQYPQLLEGGLTKEQFQFALAYGPDSMKNGNISKKAISELVFRIATDGERNQIGIAKTGTNGRGSDLYNLSEVNNFISVFTAHPFEEKDNDSMQRQKVVGDQLEIEIAEPADSQYAEILNATLKGDKLTVNYQVENVRIDEETGEEVSTVENRVAVLQKTETGKYRVMDVINEAKDAARKEAYKAALENIYVNHVFPNGTTCNYRDAQDLAQSQFTILDIDGDGEEELIIRYVSGPMAGMREVIYSFSGGDFLMEEFSEFPALVYYDNGFIRADASHNQGDDTDGWSYVMYQYMGDSDSYKEVGSGVSGDGSIESYVGTGKEMDVPFLHLTEENIQSIQ